MTRRAEAAGKTRRRVVDAAIAAYRERGVTNTSINEVARRAAVSPATVLNHFRDADVLATAAVQRITSSLRVPDERGWTERSRSARIRRLVAEMFEFYERSNPWFELFRDELASVPALREGEKAFWTQIGRLYERTFGPSLRDARVRGAVFGLTSPATFGALQEARLSVDDAAALVADVLVRLAANKRREKR